jgi:hypothetical protein
MDPPLQPPLRLQVISTKPISSKRAQNRLVNFLDYCQTRSSSKDGLTVQLEKLCAALQHERDTGKAPGLLGMSCARYLGIRSGGSLVFSSSR